MPYHNVTARTLYDSCRSDRGDRPMTEAMAWIEAENVEAVWKVVQAWFESMEAGKAVDRYPDPFWTAKDEEGRAPLTQELADHIIAELDADFELERGRFPQGRGPQFVRLPPHARMAFAQELYRVMKTEADMEAEAARRASHGERFPPGANSPETMDSRAL